VISKAVDSGFPVLEERAVEGLSRRLQHRKERAVEAMIGDARRDFPGRTGSTERREICQDHSSLSSYLSTDHHVHLLASRTESQPCRQS